MTNTPSFTVDKIAEAYAALGVCKGDKLAVAVSGGADSMALLLLSADLFDVTAITVDHGLRAESASEAEWVASECKRHNIPHVTLVWEGEKPKANLQAEAREARYSLMLNWCLSNGVRTIAAAHHMNDQAETVLLRLARGSGVYGLAGMAPVRPMGADVSLVRPLLEIEKTQLEAYLRAKDQTWLEDPSNQSEAFDRIKIRKMLENPPVDGLNAVRLAGTAGRLRRTRDALEHYEKRWLSSAVRFHPEGYAVLDASKLKDEPEEVVLRGIASVCRIIGKGMYVPRMEKLLRLFESLQDTGFRGQTLYGAQFSAKKNGILVTRELAVVDAHAPAFKSGGWDNRFEYEADGELNGLSIGAVGKEGWIDLKNNYPSVAESSIPREAILAMPAVFQDAQLQSVPMLGYNRLENADFRFWLKEKIE